MTDPISPAAEVSAARPADAIIGHNMGPAFDAEKLEEHKQSVTKYNAVAKEWLDLGVINDDEMASKINDFIAGARKAQRAVDDARKADKKPHDDAGKEVQAAYSPLLSTLKMTIDRSKGILTRYLVKKEQIERALQEKEAAEARAAQEEAERQARAAEMDNDIAAQTAAEESRKAAEKQAKAAEKPVKASVSSATGGGRAASLRTQKHAVILSDTKLFVALRAEPEVKALLQSLANRIVRAADYDGRLEGIVEIKEKVSV